MILFKNLFKLFLLGTKTTKRPIISDESRKISGITSNDFAKFLFEDDGFIFKFKTELQKIKWTDIERLTAYKRDLFTTDEICMDIVCNNWQITITEEMADWNQFLEKTKLVFPTIPANWDSEIVFPAFVENFIVLYERVNEALL